MLRYLIFNVKWVEVCKHISKHISAFERNCIVKLVTFFASFCCHWDFLLENLILKKFCMPEIIFSKKDFQTRHWNHLHFGPNFVILGTALGCFSQFCFKKKVFAVGQSWWPPFLLNFINYIIETKNCTVTDPEKSGGRQLFSKLSA